MPAHGEFDRPNFLRALFWLSYEQSSPASDCPTAVDDGQAYRFFEDGCLGDCQIGGSKDAATLVGKDWPTQKGANPVLELFRFAGRMHHKPLGADSQPPADPPFRGEMHPLS